MNTADIFSDRFELQFDRERDIFLILHPDRQKFSTPLVEIQRETLNAMTLKEAAEFIGERLILLTPPLRDMFKDYLWDGDKPPKRN